MRRELRDSVVAMMKYLQTNLPWDEKLYTQLSFMDPVNRTARETPIHGVQVAIRLSIQYGGVIKVPITSEMLNRLKYQGNEKKTMKIRKFGKRRNRISRNTFYQVDFSSRNR